MRRSGDVEYKVFVHKNGKRICALRTFAKDAESENRTLIAMFSCMLQSVAPHLTVKLTEEALWDKVAQVKLKPRKKWTRRDEADRA